MYMRVLHRLILCGCPCSSVIKDIHVYNIYTMYTRVVYRLILCGCPSDLAPAGGVAAAGGPKWADSEGVRRFSAAYYADVLVRREIVHIYIYIYNIML